jgi:diguanylate cyclase (GGDEF)-like protein
MLGIGYPEWAIDQLAQRGIPVLPVTRLTAGSRYRFLTDRAGNPIRHGDEIAMTDSPQAQDQIQLQTLPAKTSWRGAHLSPSLFVQTGLCLALIALTCRGASGSRTGFIETILAVLLLGLGFWKRTHASRIHLEISKLAALIAEVRHGREPIESLTQIEGRFRPISSVSLDLIRDVRQEKVRIAELELEVRQRIATRTESLERTIGALRQQAAKDGLTGLFNRRMLDGYLPDAIERAKVEGSPLSLLMIDIDHFKPLNDTLGHAAGDQMLRSVAQIIRSTVRESDLAFRNGGDEFVVVLEGCSEETTRVMADRLNSLGDALGRTFRLEPPPSLSIGVTCLAKVKEATAPALLREVDAALYQVKAVHHAAVQEI